MPHDVFFTSWGHIPPKLPHGRCQDHGRVAGAGVVKERSQKAPASVVVLFDGRSGLSLLTDFGPIGQKSVVGREKDVRESRVV